MSFWIDFYVKMSKYFDFRNSVHLQADICLACCFASNEKSFMMMPEKMMCTNVEACKC